MESKQITESDFNQCLQDLQQESVAQYPVIEAKEPEKDLSSLTCSGKAGSTASRGGKGTKTKKNKKQGWDQHFALLVQYLESRPGCNDVPEDLVVKENEDSYQLGQWVKEQRVNMALHRLTQDHHYQLMQLDEGRLWVNEGISSSLGSLFAPSIVTRSLQTEPQQTQEVCSKSALHTGASSAAVHVVSPDPYKDTRRDRTRAYNKRKNEERRVKSAEVKEVKQEVQEVETKDNAEEEQQYLQRVKAIQDGVFLAFTYSEVEHPAAEDIRIGIGRVHKDCRSSTSTGATIAPSGEAVAAKERCDCGEGATVAAAVEDDEESGGVIVAHLDNLMVPSEGFTVAAGCYKGLCLQSNYREERASELIPVPLSSIVCEDLKFIKGTFVSVFAVFTLLFHFSQSSHSFHSHLSTDQGSSAVHSYQRQQTQTESLQDCSGDQRGPHQSAQRVPQSSSRGVNGE